MLAPLSHSTVPSGRRVPSTIPLPSGIASISQAESFARGSMRPQEGSVGESISWYAPPPQMMMEEDQLLVLYRGRRTDPPVFGYVL
jgi:hypothetical protein